MATITIKNIPDELYEAIKLRAATNRRSINNEVIRIIENALTSRRFDPKEMAERAKKIRELSAHYYLTQEELEKWIDEGRE